MLALAISLGFLGALEAGLRLAGFRHPPLVRPLIAWDVPHDLEMMSGEGLHRRDSRMLWSPRPGAALPWAPEERVSAGGFRGADPRSAKLRVLALGDSSTFGMGVAGGDTYSALLERELNSDPRLADRLVGGDLQVLNGGTIGFTIRQGLQRYRAIREEWRPHVVVAAFGAVNEHFPMIGSPDVHKIARERSQWSGARRLYDWLGNRSRLVQVGIWVSEELRGGRKALRRADAERLAAHNSRPEREYLEDPNYLRRVSPEDFRVAYQELLDEVRADGAQLIVVRMPRRPDMEEQMPPILDYDPVVVSFAEGAGLPLVEGRRLFLERLESGTERSELFVDGFHPAPAGQRILAEALLPLVLDALAETP